MLQIGDDLGMDGIGGLWVFAVCVVAVESVSFVVFFEHAMNSVIFLNQSSNTDAVWRMSSRR